MCLLCLEFALIYRSVRLSIKVMSHVVQVYRYRLLLQVLEAFYPDLGVLELLFELLFSYSWIISSRRFSLFELLDGTVLIDAAFLSFCVDL